MKRGEIYFANLDPTGGDEIKKICLVLMLIIMLLTQLPSYLLPQCT